MALTYHSGEEIHQGDLVTYGGNAGMIELVVDGAANPEANWYLENCGAGVMVVEPKVFGRVYVHAPHDDEDLVSLAVRSDAQADRHKNDSRRSAMARPETLIPGNCYFSVGFYDNDLVMPMIDTLVYVGQSDDPDHGRMWLFKEPEAPPNSEQDGTADQGPALIAFSDKQLHEIVDFSGLIQKIREIGADHPLQPIPHLAVGPATADDFDTLEPEIAKFLNGPDFVSLTVTIRFTDDGLSLGRREGGCDMSFFTHPRHDPDEDARILSLFESSGLQPLVDYFCDRGRTRVLQFPIPTDKDVIVQLCRRVLTEVYSMRRGDTLNYHFLRESDVKS